MLRNSENSETMAKKGMIKREAVDFELSHDVFEEDEFDSPFVYSICSALFLMLCMLLYTGYVWRTKSSRLILLRHNQSEIEWKLCKGIYIVCIVTPILSGFGVERLAMLKVKLYGTEGIYLASILNPPNKLFSAGSTELLVLASPENIGDINGITFFIKTSHTMKRSCKWTVCKIEVLNYQRNERYIMRKKSLTFELKADMNTTTVYVDMVKMNSIVFIRTFHDVIHKMIAYHAWTLTKHYHGTFLFHDNILLIFLIISFTMFSNYLMNLLVPLETTKGEAFTDLGPKLPVYIFTDFLVFVVAFTFEYLLRNINIKKVNLENENPHFTSEYSIEEYEHFCVTDKFAQYLHLIFCNLGLHQCDNRHDTSSEVDIYDVHIEDLNEIVRKEDMTETLVSQWWPDCEQYNGCYLCKFKKYIHEAEKHNRFVFRNEIAPTVNLNEYAFSILTLGCCCCLSDSNDDYNEFPSLPTDTQKDKMIKNFVNALFLLLHLCQEFYLNYPKQIDVSCVYNVYKTLAYEILHYYIHVILWSSSNPLDDNIDDIKINSNSVQEDIPPAKRKFSNLVNNVVYSRRFRWLTRHRNNSKETPERKNLLNWRIHWFTHLDNALGIIIDAIIYFTYQQKYARKNENLNANMLHEIFSYASDFLETCIYFENADEELINKIETNIFHHEFLYIHSIVTGDNLQNPKFYELQLYLQRGVRDREILIKSAIDNIENNIIDSFCSEAMLLYLQKQSPAENVEFNAQTDIKMLCEKVIEDSEEEVYNENIIPIFIFARLTLFWAIGVYVRDNQHLLGGKSLGQTLLNSILSVVQANIHYYYQLKICLLEAGICEYCSGKSELNYEWYPHYINLFSRHFLKKRIILNLLIELDCKLKTVVIECLEDILNHTFEMQTSLVSMYYASVVIGQRSSMVVSFVKNIVADRFCYLDKNPYPSTFEENHHKEKFDQLNTSEVEINEENITESEEEESLPSFMDVMEKKLNLQSGELSMFYQSTYHFLDIEIAVVDLPFDCETIFFQDDNKLIPYRAKRYIQVTMIAIILIGFLVLSLCNYDLQGPTVKEWFFLSSFGIVLNIFLFEPIKVVLLEIY